MVFTSFEFSIFFGVVLVLNWRLKANCELYPPFLLAANLVFYGLGAPRFLPLLLLVAFSNWYATIRLHREHRPAWRRFIISLDVCLGLGLLIFFKYFEFGLGLLETLGLAGGLLARFQLPEIVYPIGLSFFTFQGLSLAIDHYRDPTLEPPDILTALNFVSFFPTILSGPIQRAGDFIPQMNSMRYDPDNFNLAVALILSGLFKKIALSSYLSEQIVRQVFQVPETFSPLAVWAGIYGYTAQIYLDFSGYSDLALGIGLLLGYNVGVNFNAPYLSTNVREFWRRWHISLSTWLRDYLYIPLGGNRRGSRSVNLFLTQLLGGLWHGAHLRYLIWGAAHGLALVFSHFLADRRKRRDRELAELDGLKPWQRQSARPSWGSAFWGWLLTFHFVSLGWVLFRAEDSPRAWEIVRAAFDFSRRGGEGAPLLIWLVIGLTLLMQLAGGEIREFFLKVQAGFSGPVLAVWCAFWVIIILKLGPSGVLPFIYFQY
ncbi:MAG: MBOAT family protein [Candidatus Adiutrix sp.]|jgi:D-alanyl-lipoteichoic acid acyltransferase DltB (MBOAT superfamily)|nr:MBOAT family protein [Candidatus Adiutrix sp.]